MLTGGPHNLEAKAFQMDLEDIERSKELFYINYLMEVNADYRLWAKCQKEVDAGAKLSLSFWEQARMGRVINECTNIYFIFDERIARIKIGRSKDVGRRLAALRSKCGKHLRVVSSFRGPPSMELYLHDLLSEYRLDGEWFSVCDKVLNIADLAAEGGLAGILRYALQYEKNRLIRAA